MKKLPFPTDEELRKIELEDIIIEDPEFDYYVPDFPEDFDSYEEEEYVLDFFEEGDLEDLIASDALDEFDLEEILSMNTATEAEILAALYRDGLIGVPVPISELEDEDEEDTHPEEEED